MALWDLSCDNIVCTLNTERPLYSDDCRHVLGFRTYKKPHNQSPVLLKTDQQFMRSRSGNTSLRCFGIFLSGPSPDVEVTFRDLIWRCSHTWDWSLDHTVSHFAGFLKKFFFTFLILAMSRNSELTQRELELVKIRRDSDTKAAELVKMEKMLQQTKDLIDRKNEKSSDTAGCQENMGWLKVQL